jgi:hypothetical protein
MIYRRVAPCTMSTYTGCLMVITNSFCNRAGYQGMA